VREEDSGIEVYMIKKFEREKEMKQEKESKSIDRQIGCQVSGRTRSDGGMMMGDDRSGGE
jgi:hypothetical protein